MIGDVRGSGLIFGIELVKNRTTKKPARIEAGKCVYRAWRLGLLVSFVGADSNVIELTPPLVIGASEVDSALEILDRSLKDVEKGLVSDSSVASFRGF